MPSGDYCVSCGVRHAPTSDEEMCAAAQPESDLEGDVSATVVELSNPDAYLERGTDAPITLGTGTPPFEAVRRAT